MAEKTELGVGVTGHRALMDLDRLRDGIKKALDTVKKAYPGRPITLYSAMAEGADLLVAEVFLKWAGGRLTAILPLPRVDYMQDFRDAASVIEFDRLIAQADKVVILSWTGTREQAYENAGYDVLRRCDVLLAIWDGEAGQGQGGTAEIVSAARIQGKPLVIVRAGNRKPATNDPTTLKEAQGQVVVERLALGN